MSFLLKITAGKDVGSEFVLHDGKNMVGRSRSSDVRVFNEDVSGKHFSIEIANGIAVLQNISGYGTRVDGVLVHQSVELQSGQVIEAGKSLKFIFEAPTGNALTPDGENDSELTVATKFIGDVQSDEAMGQDSGEQTSVTRFAADISDAENETQDVSEQTSVTRFADETEQTSVTRFAADISDAENETQDDSEQTSATGFSRTVIADPVERTAVSDISETQNDTAAVNVFSTASGENNRDVTGQIGESTPVSTVNDETRLFSADSENTSDDASGDSWEEEGMFFDDEELNESERTNANETQVVQTRMASMDEINFIKNQIKKQQQSRLFFKFLIFSLFVVLLGIIWMLRAPEQEKILTWPKRQEGNKVIYLTKYVSVFGQSFKKGGFDIYCPDWRNTQVITSQPDLVEIRTFLGKKADVPLTVYVQREISDEFVYEKRRDALQNSLRRLAERKNEQFNFDNSPTTEFLLPAYPEKENGVLVDKLAYQRDTGRSFFGVLRFFRKGRVNYIVRAEVPVGEKLRALPILNSDTFLVLNIAFVRRHWEGNDQYSKGDISRTIISLRDELQRNSPMQYPRLEREIKSILAQALYEKNRNIYEEAESLLLNLREKQQHWYNSQKIRWISAVRENNTAEKFKIKNDCEAVFSVVGDKRRYDILRDHWE